LACTGRRNSPQAEFDRIRLSFLQGNLASAKLEAEAAAKQHLGHNQEWNWKFRLLLAEILAHQGLSRDVLSLLTPEIPQELATSDSAVRLHILRALAWSHLGHASEADQNLEIAQKLCDSSHYAVSGEVARIAGAIAAERNDTGRAANLFQQSLEIARAQKDKFLEASDLLNLGVVAIGKEHFDESVDWSNAASALAKEIGAGLTEEKALGNLGWAYFKMGDFDRSLNFFQAAGKRAQELGAVIDQVEWLNNQGLVYFQMDRYGEAEKYYRDSLALARSSQNQPQIVQALIPLGFLSEEVGQIENGRNFCNEALRLARSNADRQDELSALLVQGEIFARAGEPERAEELLTQVARDPQSDTSLRWEAHDRLGRLYEKQNRVAAEREFRASLAVLEAARGSLHLEEFRLPFLANAIHLYDDYVRFLVGQNNPRLALQVADYSRAQTLLEGLGLSAGKTGARSSAGEAQNTARTLGATILFYWLGRDESYLWAVTGEETKLFSLPPRTQIEALVQRYRKALTSPLDPLESANADGHALYDALVAPAAGLMPHNARVVVVPDGVLNNLNFETLLAPQPAPHYWIEDVTIANANSIAMLTASRGRSGKSNRNLLLMGDAVAVDPKYRELANAAAETKKIEDHFAGTARSVFTQARATPAAYFASAPEQFSFIHFVAHGTASQFSPLDSAIVLSNSGNSFKLYARDIIAHPLHAELVTISSCYGEGTRAYTGEGLVGLSWAFLRAGAHNVIGALWEVSDNSTPQLMDRFYGDLRDGRTPAAALRQAKLEMLHSQGVFRKPFYWAPFQLYTGS
jgi:CHAT domain-containing protein